MSDWQPLPALPDLRRVGTIALDTETKDGGLLNARGPGWPWGDGYIAGVSAAYRAEGTIRAHYFPIRHPDSQNFDPANVFQWVRDHVAAGVRFVTQNGLYDWGWLRADAGIVMPPSEQLEEIGALATMVDENRYQYGLAALCAWRGLPGKDEALLRQAVKACGVKVTKKNPAQAHIWRLPAHLVGPYAEADAVSTLALFESLDPVLDQENTRGAYRLEVDLLPLVHEMRRRGIRIDITAAEQARELLLRKRDAVFVELSAKLGANVSMEEIGRTDWLAETFDVYGITYPRTAKGRPSFTAGSTGWMHKHPHWLPPLIVKADKYNNAAVNFLETYILGHAVNGRVYAEIHPHRSDEGGTRSLRFSYSNPPLQLMPAHDAELAPLIRGVFLPEEGEVWAKPDLSQQEFRFVAHYSARHKLPGANNAVVRYRDDPNTDYHGYAAEITGLERTSAKAVNFATIYGAGARKFAQMVGKSEAEAREILERYHRELPFVSKLTEQCERAARFKGYLTLYDGARRHFNHWAPGGKWEKGAGPCEREEAIRRIQDPGHPWYGRKLYRADTRKALNALIQGSAARHTKLWMRACWREGIVPLLQMHDSLDCSVSSREQAELVARLGCEAVTLEVPMQVDLKYGRNWGDACHTWEELHATASTSKPSPAYQVDWGALLEREFPRANGGPADKVDVEPSAPPISPIPQDEDAFIQARMLEEGIPWEGPSSFPPPPPAQDKEEPDDEETDQSENEPKSGNGHDDGYPWGEREIGRMVAEYIYRDAAKQPHLLVRKFEWTEKSGNRKKAYPQYHRENGRWVKGKPAGPAIPYRLPELLTAPMDVWVDLMEGEKDCDRGAKFGLITTTNPEGATMPDGKRGKWQPELNEYFRGRRVRIHADNDLAGEAHCAKVIGELRGIAKEIAIVRYPELPPGGDFSDFMDNGGTLKAMVARAVPEAGTLDSVCAADVEIEDFDWIWPNRFARGKIGLIVGMPEEGKGQLLSDIMARVTTGAAWPCGEGVAPLGNVILLSAEDDIKDTITPRLIAAGADLRRITILKMMRDAGKERMFSLISDLHALRLKVLELGGVVLIVVDPISAYLGIGKVDSFRATDVRAILSPLKQFAEDLELGVLGVLHFNKKTDITNLMLRVSDSLAYSAASRHVYGIVSDEDNKRKLFVRGKNNIARAEQKTLAFNFGELEVGTSKKTGRTVRAPHLVWHPEPVDITATEALRALAESKSPSALDNAKQFLNVLLSDGPVGVKDVHEAREEHGISKMTLKRAREQLGIDPKKDGPKNEKGEITWRWHPAAKKEDE
jgi:DNA polymerase I-like protein with 3'-5' exonuclease and polymerase domains